MTNNKKLNQKRDVILPLQSSNNTLVITDEEKTTLFGNHLSNIFQPHYDIAPNNIHANKQYSTDVSPSKTGKPAEIKSIITKLKNNKSHGYDQINNKIRVLKNLTKEKKTILFLTHIYNSTPTF